MAGRTGTLRRRDGACRGCEGPATKQKILKHWGDALPSMTAEARKKHAAAGVIMIDNRHSLRPEDVKGYELGIVSYKGAGKYGKRGTKNDFHWFDDLPDSDEVVTKETPAPVPPDGQGWWPVIALRTESARTVEKILIICFYQLISDGTLVAWWIYL